MRIKWHQVYLLLGLQNETRQGSYSFDNCLRNADILWQQKLQEPSFISPMIFFLRFVCEQEHWCHILLSNFNIAHTRLSAALHYKLNFKIPSDSSERLILLIICCSWHFLAWILFLPWNSGKKKNRSNKQTKTNWPTPPCSIPLQRQKRICSGSMKFWELNVKIR